jgi:hypothetical protein
MLARRHFVMFDRYVISEALAWLTAQVTSAGVPFIAPTKHRDNNAATFFARNVRSSSEWRSED